MHVITDILKVHTFVSEASVKHMYLSKIYLEYNNHHM